MSLSSKNAFPVPGEKAFPGLWQAIGELLKLTFALIAFETLTDKLFEVVESLRKTPAFCHIA